MTRRFYRLEKVLPHRLASEELLDAVRAHPEFGWQAAKLWVYADEGSRASRAADVLYREETGRAGFGWGADRASFWTDCKGLGEAVRLCLQMSARELERGDS